MVHVTFIHGIQNKPPAERLRNLWLGALADGPDGLNLAPSVISTSMVYWADILYSEPASLTEAVGASAGSTAEAPPAPTAEEAAFVTGLAAKVGGALAVDEIMPETGLRLERVPLPWAVKKAFLDTFLRDVHHYLFDVEFSPRPGARYRVRRDIRKRFADDLKTHAPAAGPHVVVSHSLGTVIAYDCLKNVPECPAIDALVTLGSPLGLDEVQDKLAPSYSRKEGYPSERLRGDWINLFDRLDPVCGFDPSLANDFAKSGAARVVDIRVNNRGAWRHDIQDYLSQADLRSQLRRLLG